MGGCMVTKVPEVLRKGTKRGVVPDHPRVIGYASILLNATGLRKRPHCGYTRAARALALYFESGESMCRAIHSAGRGGES
jgi:hypothetical protein